MTEIGIRKTHDNLKDKLSSYIKAQYFAENDILIKASEDIFEKKGVICQEPYIEIAKSYQQSKTGFTGANIDNRYKEILGQLAGLELGVYKTPFIHQIQAIEYFFSGKNVLVTTGTGSGKTECFLWPILTNLIYEAQYCPGTWKKEGIRALILYPMNALVSDQLGRIRKIIGRKDDAFYKLISKNGTCRRAYFGMYTGRTPYAGENDSDKNRDLAKVIRENYLNSVAYKELEKIGRIPAKDLEEFVKNLSEGNQKTGKMDSELYTRKEMQIICPDILITNYSMLEYMLMRPIEESIWEKTINWLNESEENKLLLVIDEAHMYRGAPGGEVSLLIRRLLDRLGISTNKLRCILTSASIPEKNDNEIQKFACGLTSNNDSSNFVIVRETVEKVENPNKCDINDANFYASLSLANLQGDINTQMIEIEKIARHKSIEMPLEKEESIRVWLYCNLCNEPVFKRVLDICNNGGKALSEIARDIFDVNVCIDLAEKALENILQLGIMAKSPTKKILLGSKVHMMFRGLQGLFACTNPQCSHGYEGMGIKLGYVTNEDLEVCPYCESRMFELIMDRRCGTIYLRAFIDKQDDYFNSFKFLWARKNKLVKESKEIHLWIMPKDRKDIFKLNKNKGKAKDNSVIGCIDSKTGMLFEEESFIKEDGYLKVLVPGLYDKNNKAYSFGTCPNCGRDYNKITSFITRGNEPFANIVREQFELQVPKNPNLKNEGKKVLLFSDSRQRAATLARDMTIVSDGEAGRQAIFLAQKKLDESKDSSKTIDLLYYAFLKVVYENQLDFFYGEEKELFKNQLKKFEEFYGNRERKNFEYKRVKDKVGNPPMMFYQLLLKNISDNFRSYNNLGLGQVVLAEQGEAGEDVEEDILERIEDTTKLELSEIRNIYNTWIQYLIVRKMAVFPEVSDEVREHISTYDGGSFGIEENIKFPKFMTEIFKEKGINNDIIKELLIQFEDLIQIMNNPSRAHHRRYILGTWLELKTCENSKWYKCKRCSGMSTYTLWDHCIYCGSDKHIKEVNNKEQLQRYSLWTKPVFDAWKGQKIRNITIEEHTAQLSYKDLKREVWGTTEKNELAFRDILLGEDKNSIDVLSCTTTMEVGIDIGSLTSVGLRNVPPMRENYQQRAGRAGRAGAAVSSIVTYTENGPHDSWYFRYPKEIISGEPRTPWIDSENIKLVKRHINLVLLEEYLRENKIGLDDIYTIEFFDNKEKINYKQFCKWVYEHTPLEKERMKRLVPIKNFNWGTYREELKEQMEELKQKIEDTEFIYQPIEDNENKSNTYMLMDVLFSEGLMPNYSFPRNIVHFWVEDFYGKVKESPERSIDIALSEYAPGRQLVINKQTYISGGLFDYYTKFNKENRYHAAKPWIELEENKKIVQCCSNIQCGWFGVNEDYNKCPLCGDILEKHSVIRPWGFSAREGRNIPETQDTQEVSYASRPSYASMPSGNNLSNVGTAGYIGLENRSDQKLVIVNKGPEEKGFELCQECGAIEPAIIDEKERIKRKRPYRIPYLKDDTMRCRHNYKNVYLGYEFNTDMMVMEIKLDGEKLDLYSSYNVWLLTALTTFSEALVLATSRELDVEFNDIKSGFRLRTSGAQMYADVYLYDSLSSGAGYASRASSYIEEILDKMKEILSKCKCANACPNCLQHFGNQKYKENLDRFLGLDFLEFIRFGYLKTRVEKAKEEEYVKKLNGIAKLHGIDETITEVNGRYYLQGSEKNIEILFYSSMCNYNKKNSNILYVSNRICEYAISEVWKEIQERL